DAAPRRRKRPGRAADWVEDSSDTNLVCGLAAIYALVAPGRKRRMRGLAQRPAAMSSTTTTCLPSPACAPLHKRDWLTPIELSLLGAIWGASFLFMRVAAPEFGSFALVEMRLALGALVLLPFAWHGRAHLPASLWPKLAAIGAINSAVPFVLFAWSAQYAPAAVSAICNATTVLFAALVAFCLYGERMGARRALALLVGFAGVV